MHAVARKGLGPQAAVSDPDLQAMSRRKKSVQSPWVRLRVRTGFCCSASQGCHFGD